jgi:hypothetical protein
MPSCYLCLTPLQKLCIECLENRQEFSLKANTILREIADDYGVFYPEARRIELKY